MERFSDISEIQKLIVDRMDDINRAGVFVHLKQVIPYGTQLRLEGQGGEGLINVYFSRKKGVSVVDCSQNAVSRLVVALLRGQQPSAGSRGPVDEGESSLTTWVGTDESGKGDFFGPLVVAGFVVERGMLGELFSLGVADSKTLSSGEIRRIAAALWKHHRDRIEVLSPSNAKYNELYVSFANLNRLLAWGHARVIENLVGRWQGTAIDGVVSDKFGDERHICNALKSMRDLRIIQRHRGESNPAVAAASILARDRFEHLMERLGEEFGMRFPFGAGNEVIAAGRAFVEKHGRGRLSQVAKLHFRTIGQL